MFPCGVVQERIDADLKPYIWLNYAVMDVASDLFPLLLSRIGCHLVDEADVLNDRDKIVDRLKEESNIADVECIRLCRIDKHAADRLLSEVDRRGQQRLSLKGLRKLNHRPWFGFDEFALRAIEGGQSLSSPGTKRPTRVNSRKVLVR